MWRRLPICASARRAFLGSGTTARRSSASPACRPGVRPSPRDRPRRGRESPDVFLLVGGHAAAPTPWPLERGEIDAVAWTYGERCVPAVADALERGRPLDDPGLASQDCERLGLHASFGGAHEPRPGALPARHLVSPIPQPIPASPSSPSGLVETARGCPFRCNFCSVWQLYGRSFRERSSARWWRTFPPPASTSSSPTSFLEPPERTWPGGGVEAQRRGGSAGSWCKRAPTPVCRNPELLEAWRPAGPDFDVFFGRRPRTDAGLTSGC